MNAVPAETLPPGPVAGWTRRRWILLVVLAFLAHLLFVVVFGVKTQIAPRPAANVPRLQVADPADELIALRDPTLFVLPNANDFAAAIWLRPPPVEPPSFRWTEAPRWLPPGVASLGALFRQFMQTNLFAAAVELSFKPEPKLLEPDLPLPSPFPPNSTFQLGGGLASRRLLNRINVPSLPVNDVLPPSKVQVLVDAAGNVASVVLLETSGWETADARALALARQARFAPAAANLTFGEMTFCWHTVPVAATNSPDGQ